MESLILYGRFDAWDFFANLYFGSTSPVYIVLSILSILGMWQMFKKSGVKSWWALIPIASAYQLSRCAMREPEGRPYAMILFLQRINLVLGAGLWEPLANRGLDDVTILLLVSVIQVTMLIASFGYSLRIYGGLIQVYNVRKRWMWLWVFFDFIPLFVWGFRKKYQPQWKVEDINAEMARLASHGTSTVMDEGLSVNLEERTTVEFFQKKVLLRDIHMAIPQGHLVLLLGGSGAGKTTYLNAINGYEKANAEVLLNRENVYKHYRKMQYEVGFVPQSEMMRGKDTVFNTLMDAAKLRLPKDVSPQQRKERVEEVMEMMGLTPVKNSLVDKLSGGQKKRLSISIEFLSNPSLFILDEPDSGLDGVMARELFEHLRQIADEGKIVIVITHTPDRVIDLFDDVIVLAKDSARTGRLAYYGSVEGAREFFGRSTMEEIVKAVNPPEEGGDGLADEFVMRYAEVQNA